MPGRGSLVSCLESGRGAAEPVARIDHTFRVPLPAHEAQALFREQVAPQLRLEGMYKVQRDEPGRLRYRVHGTGRKTGPFGVGLRMALARRLEVTFTGVDSDTIVRVRGNAIRATRAWMMLLGSPGHWPAAR